MPVPYICIVRVQSNDKSNDYIRYRYPENVTALLSPLLITKYNIVTSSLPKKNIGNGVTSNALLPNPVTMSCSKYSFHILKCFTKNYSSRSDITYD